MYNSSFIHPLIASIIGLSVGVPPRDVTWSEVWYALYRRFQSPLKSRLRLSRSAGWWTASASAVFQVCSYPVCNRSASYLVLPQQFSYSCTFFQTLYGDPPRFFFTELAVWYTLFAHFLHLPIFVQYTKKETPFQRLLYVYWCALHFRCSAFSSDFLNRFSTTS